MVGFHELHLTAELGNENKEIEKRIFLYNALLSSLRDLLCHFYYILNVLVKLVVLKKKKIVRYHRTNSNCSSCKIVVSFFIPRTST